MSLLLQIIFLLIATLILVPLAKRYSSTTVLGYLIAGLLLGSQGLGFIDDQQLIQPIMYLGMIMLMFFAGFAFRPQKLWIERRSIIKNSGLALAVLSVLFSSIGFALTHDLFSSILIGCMLTFASTNIVQQLLQQKQQLNTSFGQASLASLQFQIFVTVVLIALFPLLEDTASTRHGIAYFAAIIATISGLFLASRYIVRPAFRYLVRRKSIELIPALGLFVVLSVILLMGVLNIHVLIGTFLAGLLLAETEFKAEVARVIEPFKDIAIGLFFLAIGLSISLVPLYQSPIFIFVAILVLVLVKALIIGTIHYYQHRRIENSLLVAVALAQCGELSLILFKLAEDEQLLSKDLLQPMFLIVVGSMLLTPLLYWLMHSKILPTIQKKAPITAAEVPQHPIVIVGFGRFGQVIGRALHAQGLKFSVIDSNQPDAEFIEQYGHYFLDADVTQVENLRAAGIEYCKLLILAIDDVEDCMNLARHLRLNYPDLNLFVRARDRHHAHLLDSLGIQHVWRETYASSLEMAAQALIETGLSATDAHTQIECFRVEDQRLLEQQHGSHQDDDSVETYPNAIAELEYLFENTKTLSQDRLNSNQNKQSDANSSNETT